MVTCDVLIRKRYHVADPSPEDAAKTTYGIVAHEYREDQLLDDSETLKVEIISCEKG
jgi:hypothetical protein